MPISGLNGKQWTADWFAALSIRSAHRVLDVGVGVGTYSTLCRKAGQEWVGIEVWGPYIERFELIDKYEKLVIGDCRYIDYSLLGHFDVAFFGDVLEHMNKPDAAMVINRVSMSSRFVLLSFPVGPDPQGMWDGNPFEAHMAEWVPEDLFLSFGDNVAFAFVDGPLCVAVLARSQPDAEWVQRLGEELLVGREGRRVFRQQCA